MTTWKNQTKRPKENISGENKDRKKSGKLRGQRRRGSTRQMWQKMRSHILYYSEWTKGGK